MPKTSPTESTVRAPRGMGSAYSVTIAGVRCWQVSRSFTVLDPETGKKIRRRVTGTAVQLKDAQDNLAFPT